MNAATAPSTEVRRVRVTADPFADEAVRRPVWRERGEWPAAWIGCPGAHPPFVAAFRLAFEAAPPSGGEPIRLHVTADERYELFLDGERVDRGPERGAPDRWYFHTLEARPAAGPHVLVARVWALGELSADAQMSVSPGFLLAAEGAWGPLVSTGIAPWTAKLLGGYRFLDPVLAPWKGATVEVDGGSFAWGFERGVGGNWLPAEVGRRGMSRRVDWELPPRHLLVPATLPPMTPVTEDPLAAAVVRHAAIHAPGRAVGSRVPAGESSSEAVSAWSRLLSGAAPLTLAARAVVRVVIDLRQYHCAYPSLVVTGGAGSDLRLAWAESLFETEDPRGPKGNRDAVDGKHFIGQGDGFVADGGRQRRFETLWWEAGRYLEVRIATGGEPLVVERLALEAARYPLEMESSFSSSDRRLDGVVPLLVRGIQMCANETFFDCPYYEELQYGGDARIEALVGYVMARDDRLARKAIDLFDASRLASGLTQSRYPCRIMQIICSWSLWWVEMVRDHALWRDGDGFTRTILPGVRATMEGFQRWMGADGLLHAPEGWNNFDWVPAWAAEAGCPPDAVLGVSGVINWHLVHTLAAWADLERRLGEPLVAQLAEQRAARLAAAALDAFWDERRGLIADDLARRSFSEHAQCLALLGGQLDDTRRRRVAEGLVRDGDLSRATISFSHYLFEALRLIGRIDVLLDRLSLWFDLARLGLRTGIEQPEPSRSDCHGWASHPLYHFFATILGIRPAAPGFRSVEVRPMLGPLERAAGRLVHPGGGEIVLEVRREGARLHGRLETPPGVAGALVLGDERLPVDPGSAREF